VVLIKERIIVCILNLLQYEILVFVDRPIEDQAKIVKVERQSALFPYNYTVYRRI
jgi:hypothetical protein